MQAISMQSENTLESFPAPDYEDRVMKKVESNKPNPEQISTGSSTQHHQKSKVVTPQSGKTSISKNQTSQRESLSMDDLPEESPPKKSSQGNIILEVKKCGALLTPDDLGKSRAANKRKPEKSKLEGSNFSNRGGKDK
jgi:hypothetical protein